MSLAHVVHRIITDADFAAHFRLDPEATLTQAGFTLEPDACQILVNVLQDLTRVRQLVTNLEPGPDGPDWAKMNIKCTERHEPGIL